MSDVPPDLESGTIWQHKPWWCQPWSIVLTGVAAMALSWIWLHLWWLTALVTVAVLAWWGLFLVLVPKTWQEASQPGGQSD